MGIKHEDVKVSGDVGRASEWNKDHKIDSPVDFDKNEAISFVVENRTDFPAGPVVGQIIYRTDLDQSYIWNGTGWLNITKKSELVVASDGSGDYTTIEAAITYLTNGGKILVKRGTYTPAEMSANKYLNLVNGLTIEGIGTDTIISFTQADNKIYFNANGKHNITVKNLKIQFNADESKAGQIIFDIQSASFIHVERCTMDAGAMDFYDNVYKIDNSTADIWIEHNIDNISTAFGWLGGATAAVYRFHVNYNNIKSSNFEPEYWNDSYFMYNRGDINLAFGHTNNCYIIGNYLYLNDLGFAASSKYNIISQNYSSNLYLEAECNYNNCCNNIIDNNVYDFGTGNTVANNTIF